MNNQFDQSSDTHFSKEIVSKINSQLNLNDVGEDERDTIISEIDRACDHFRVEKSVKDYLASERIKRPGNSIAVKELFSISLKLINKL